MSARTIAASRQLPVPADVRSDLFDGVPTEAGDRRAISIFAMLALDEPDDRRPETQETDGLGLVAFLPEVCSPRLARR